MWRFLRLVREMILYQRPTDEHGALAAQICRFDDFGVAGPHVEGPESHVNLPDCGEAGWSCRPTLLGDIAEKTAKVPETDFGLVNKRYGLSKVGPPCGG